MEIADFRWVRLFSIATVWVLGTQLLIICICHLAVKPLDAVAIALSIFLVPSFLYSVLGSAAWAPHLVSIFFALWGYAALSRTNVQATAFFSVVRRRNFPALLQQAMAYGRMRQVILAFLIFQLAFYSYPPQAMIIACLPIVVLFFSAHPPEYRALLAIRDLVYLGLSVVLYAVSAKLIYIPIVRLFVYRFSDAWYEGYRTPFDIRIAENYRYSFNYDVGEALNRLKAVAKVAADLWFLPQLDVHRLVATVILLVVLCAVAWNLWGRKTARLANVDLLERLRVDGWRSNGVIVGVTIVGCFILACAAVVGSSGGFITYRAIAMPIAVVCVLALFAVRYLGEFAAALAGAVPRWRLRAGDALAIALVAIGAGAFFYSSYLTMRLARNEHAYYSSMLREAKAKKADMFVLVDPRLFKLPEEIPVVFDQRGRAVPPYEMGCFSGYCLQTDAILRIVAAEQGMDPKQLKIRIIREDRPGPGVTCELLRSPDRALPDAASEDARSIVRTAREAQSSVCFTYDLKWHDVSIDLASQQMK